MEILTLIFTLMLWPQSYDMGNLLACVQLCEHFLILASSGIIPHHTKQHTLLSPPLHIQSVIKALQSLNNS